MWWNEIDIITIESFYDEISDIRKYIENNTDIQFLKILDFEKIDYKNTFFEEKKGFYINTGRIGIVSKNTVTQIPLNSLQYKHQLIQDIINFLKENLEFTSLVNNPKTIYKEYLFCVAWHLIIIDYISFIDNLFNDIDNKYVKSDSLIKIWEDNNIEGLSLLKEFKKEIDIIFESKIRKIRDNFSVHIDSKMTNSDLNSLFLGLDLGKLHKTILKEVNLYLTSCKVDIRTCSFSNPERQKLPNDILDISSGAFKNYK